jgi:hypothetical protein
VLYREELRARIIVTHVSIQYGEILCLTHQIHLSTIESTLTMHTAGDMVSVLSYHFQTFDYTNSCHKRHRGIKTNWKDENAEDLVVWFRFDDAKHICYG